MTTIDVIFSPKRPQDVERFAINFAKLLPPGDAIDSAEVVVTPLKGVADPVPAMLNGLANIDGTIVSQVIGAGVSGMSYGVRFKITSAGGLHLEIVGSLQVRD